VAEGDAALKRMNIDEKVDRVRPKPGRTNEGLDGVCGERKCSLSPSVIEQSHPGFFEAFDGLDGLLGSLGPAADVLGRLGQIVSGMDDPDRSAHGGLRYKSGLPYDSNSVQPTKPPRPMPHVRIRSSTGRS
jgi:hypothetical protein